MGFVLLLCQVDAGDIGAKPWLKCGARFGSEESLVNLLSQATRVADGHSLTSQLVRDSYLI